MELKDFASKIIKYRENYYNPEHHNKTRLKWDTALDFKVIQLYQLGLSLKQICFVLYSEDHLFVETPLISRILKRLKIQKRSLSEANKSAAFVYAFGRSYHPNKKLMALKRGTKIIKDAQIEIELQELKLKKQMELIGESIERHLYKIEGFKKKQRQGARLFAAAIIYNNPTDK